MSGSGLPRVCSDLACCLKQNYTHSSEELLWGRGMGLVLRSPGTVVAEGEEGDLLFLTTPPSLPEGVSAKTTFRGKKARKSNKQSRK